MRWKQPAVTGGERFEERTGHDKESNQSDVARLVWVRARIVSSQISSLLNDFNNAFTEELQISERWNHLYPDVLYITLRDECLSIIIECFFFWEDEKSLACVNEQAWPQFRPLSVKSNDIYVEVVKTHFSFIFSCITLPQCQLFMAWTKGQWRVL